MLAHEVAHVVQQSRVGGTPNVDHEREAWSAARAVGRGERATVQLGSAPGVAQCGDKDPVNKAGDDLSLPSGGHSPDLGEARAIGSAGERHQFAEAAESLRREGYTEIYFKDNFKGWVKKAFPNKSASPEVVAVDPKGRRVLVEDFTAGPWSTTNMKPGDPRRLPQDVPTGPKQKPPTQEIAHLEKTKAYGEQAARNLPPELNDASVIARDRYYKQPGVSIEVNIKKQPPAPPSGGAPPEHAPSETGSASHERSPGTSLEPTPRDLGPSVSHGIHEPQLHVPHAPHVPHVPHGVKGPKIHGGLLIGIVIGGAVYLWTGDAFAAAQTFNPAANTTEAVIADRVSAGDVAIGVVKDLVSLTPPGAIALLIWDLGQPRGEFPYSQKLADQAKRDGRNPFCAQCHAPGGALDPDNEWNRKAERNRFKAFLSAPSTVPWANLTPADRQALQDFLSAK